MTARFTDAEVRALLRVLERRWLRASLQALRSYRPPAPRFEFNQQTLLQMLVGYSAKWRRESVSPNRIKAEETELARIVHSTLTDQQKAVFSVQFLKFIETFHKLEDATLQTAFQKIKESIKKILLDKKALNMANILRRFYKTHIYEQVDFGFYKMLKRYRDIVNTQRFFAKRFQEKMSLELLFVDAFRLLRHHNKIAKLFFYLYKKPFLSYHSFRTLIATELGLSTAVVKRVGYYYFRNLLLMKMLHEGRRLRLKSGMAFLRSWLRMARTPTENLTGSQLYLQFSNFSFTNNVIKSQTFIEEKVTAEQFQSYADPWQKNINQSTVIDQKFMMSNDNLSRRSVSVDPVLTEKKAMRSDGKQFMDPGSLAFKRCKGILKAVNKVVMRVKKQLIERLRKAPKATLANSKRALKIIYGKVTDIKPKTVTTVTMIDEEGKSIVGTKRSFLMSKLIRPARATCRCRKSSPQIWSLERSTAGR